ncbi:MAG: DUF2007 domain-containing protein [Pseudomonadota bacterium]
MKRIHTTADFLQAGYLKSILEERGIQCVLKNDYLSGGAGELPLNECWPEIWVIDERDEQLAAKIIEENRQSKHGENWVCNNCGEQLEAQFSHCWQCGASR